MSNRSREVIKAHHRPAQIRNICVIAHVDHGKTTLSDSLIASNGIISQKLAGEIRFLDNRKDEQERMITMKSSNISLLFKTSQEKEPYLVNLIDSPGHVDFSGEVSSAVRLSDGALVVVDAVEGVCNQTHTVLRQAWKENVKPCLIINKIDRLVTELKLEPEEAYLQLNKILESVNVIMATLFAEDALKQSDQTQLTEEDMDDSEVYFSPEQGNVLFACAKYGWGFRIQHFAEMYAKRLNMNREVLNKTLWGEFYFSPKEKSIKKNSSDGKYPRMFVQFILQNIWHLYRVVLEEKNLEATEKVAKVLGLKIPDREMRIFQNPNANYQSLLTTIFQQWLPLSSAIIHMVIDKLPSPVQAQQNKLPKLLQPLPIGASQEQIDVYNRIKDAVMECRNGDKDPVVIFVSKVISGPGSNSAGDTAEHGPRIFVPKQRDTSGSLLTIDAEDTEQTTSNNEENNSDFVGFARIFSGNLRRGAKVFVFKPKYDPAVPDKHMSTMTVDDIFMLMGRDLEKLENIPAGNIFGLGGIGTRILKTATVSTERHCCPLAAVQFSQPIVRVAVEPKNPQEMPVLIAGLKKLNQADASVEVYVQESGEHVICAAGEMHLERCLLDLREMFAPIELEVSSPIVSFKETIVKQGTVVNFTTRGKVCTMKLYAAPLPAAIVSFLQANTARIKQLFSATVPKQSPQFLEFQNKLKEVFDEAGWSGELDKIWCFGPKRCGPNIMFNHTEFASSPYWRSIVSSEEVRVIENEEISISDAQTAEDEEEQAKPAPETEEQIKEWQYAMYQSLDFAITNGFQLATTAGTLCDEPLSGVAFFIEHFDVKYTRPDELHKYGPFKGQIMSSICQALRQSIENGSPHLVEPFYRATVQIPTKWFGDATSVLFQRRSKITNEQFLEGTDICIIEADIPVVASFGFSDQIMRKTSGAARVQMQFSHWALLDEDPNWEPTTEDEKEEWGTNLSSRGENVARLLVDSIRRRKGLFVEEKIVEHADKQRTLSRNK